MEQGTGKMRGRFWAGAWCASLWTWLASALSLLVVAFFGHFNGGAGLQMAIGMLSFVAIFYGAAFIAAGFWHSVADSRKCRNWSGWTVLIILCPLFVLGLYRLEFVGFALLIFVFPLAIVLFSHGMRWSSCWWKERGWRHLLGLANDYERDGKSDDKT